MARGIRHNHSITLLIGNSYTVIIHANPTPINTVIIDIPISTMKVVVMYPGRTVEAK